MQMGRWDGIQFRPFGGYHQITQVHELILQDSTPNANHKFCLLPTLLIGGP